MKTPEQKQHLLDIADAIESEPTKFDMGNWWSGEFDGGAAPLVPSMEFLGGCGTTMCIAGWSGYLAGEPDKMNSWNFAARSGCGLLQAGDLCVYHGIDAVQQMPVGLRAEGAAYVLRQMAGGTTAWDALEEAAQIYVEDGAE